MKVLVVTNMYPTEDRPFDGIFVKEQVESLKEIGIAVDVFHIKGKQGRLNYPAAFPKLTKFLASNRYDIIHAHHTYCMFPIAFARKLLRLKTPVILTFHEPEFLIPKGIRDPEADFLKRFIYSRKIKEMALQMADLVIPVWEGLTKALGYQGQEVTIPCGTDTELFKPMDREECRKRLGLSLDKKIIFFPADVADPARWTHKGYDLFQKAMNLLDSKSKDIMIITGGNIRHENMPYYMNAANAVVQTSRFEASPMAVKECMAVNMPVVSTNAGDTREIFGSTPGYYICERDPKDVAAKIRQALEFEGRTHGRERILSLGLSLEQVAREYLKIYQEIIEKS